MADVWEKDLAQKSLLTVNDFIRVVGSDNVSYKQLLSDVNRTIPLSTVGNLTTEALIDQAYNTAHEETSDKTPYRRLISHGTTHSILGGGTYFLMGYRHSSTYGWQMIASYGIPTRVFTRSINNGTWTTWAKDPTRAEVDALTDALSGVSFTRTNTTANTPKSITLPNNYRGIIAFVDTAQGRDGLYFLTANSSGAVNYVPIYATSDLTLDKSVANKLTITSTTTTMIAILNVSGTATV